MTKDQATKRPWKLKTHGNLSCPALPHPNLWIDSDTDIKPAIANGWTLLEAEANARLIVKAVNCHDELVEALKETERNLLSILNWIDLGEIDGIGLTKIEMGKWQNKIEQALSKAESDPIK